MDNFFLMVSYVTSDVPSGLTLQTTNGGQEGVVVVTNV